MTTDYGLCVLCGKHARTAKRLGTTAPDRALQPSVHAHIRIALDSDAAGHAVAPWPPALSSCTAHVRHREPTRGPGASSHARGRWDGGQACNRGTGAVQESLRRRRPSARYGPGTATENLPTQRGMLGSRSGEAMAHIRTLLCARILSAARLLRKARRYCGAAGPQNSWQRRESVTRSRRAYLVGEGAIVSPGRALLWTCRHEVQHPRLGTQVATGAAEEDILCHRLAAEVAPLLQRAAGGHGLAGQWRCMAGGSLRCHSRRQAADGAHRVLSTSACLLLTPGTVPAPRLCTTWFKMLLQAQMDVKSRACCWLLMRLSNNFVGRRPRGIDSKVPVVILRLADLAGSARNLLLFLFVFSQLHSFCTHLIAAISSGAVRTALNCDNFN